MEPSEALVYELVEEEDLEPRTASIVDGCLRLCAPSSDLLLTTILLNKGTLHAIVFTVVYTWA